MKKLIVALLASLCAAVLLAQGISGGGGGKPAPKRAYELRIELNVRDAQIFIDGNQIRGFSVRLQPGDHTIRVEARGYESFNGRVNMRGDQTFRVQLKKKPEPRQDRDNRKGGEMQGNAGGDIQSNQATVEPQPPKKQIEIKIEEKPQVNDNPPPPPQPKREEVRFYTFTLQIDINGARIFVDGVEQRGPSLRLTPGKHRITVRADGYEEYTEDVDVQKDNDMLRPRLKARPRPGHKDNR
jgi:hypothetical protein